MSLRLHSLWIGLLVGMTAAQLGAATIESRGRHFSPENIAGFSVRLDATLSPSEMSWHRDHLTVALAEVAQAVPQWSRILRRFPIWICNHTMESSKTDGLSGAVWDEDERRWGVSVFHPSIKNASRQWYRGMIAHELAHGFDQRCLSRSVESRIDAAYQGAQSGGLYRNVKNEYDQLVDRAYALTDGEEYFAELFAAYFVINDTYPFVRDDVYLHDPAGAALMEFVLGLSLPSQHRPDLRFWRNGRYQGGNLYEALPRRQRGESDWDDKAYLSVESDGATDDVGLHLIRMKTSDRRRLTFRASNGGGYRNISAAMITGRASVRVFEGYDRQLYITKRKKEDRVAAFVIKATSSLFSQRADSYEVRFKQ